MNQNTKPHAFDMGSNNSADGESVSGRNNTHRQRSSAKYQYRRRDSLPYQTKSISDAAFIDSKLAAENELKLNGLIPIWSESDLQRERKILMDRYLDLIYDLDSLDE
jgi:hypothetical protein